MAGLSLSGLASGVDTASIVDQLMALERQSLTKIGYRKAAVTGQQDALKEVASKLSALKDAALALSADSTWAQKQTVESSDPDARRRDHARRRRHRRPVDLRSTASPPRPSAASTSAPAPSTATARPRAPRRSRSSTPAPAHRRRHDRRRGRRDQAADRRRDQRQDRRARPSPRWSRTPTASSSSSCRRARPARTPTSRSSPTGVAQPRTATYVRRHRRRPPGRLPGRRRRPAALGLERRRERDPGRPAHAQGRHDRARPPSRSPSPRSTATAIKAKVKAFVDAYNAVVDTTRSKLTEQRRQEPDERLPGRPRPALRRLGPDRHARRACARTWPTCVDADRHQRPRRPRHRDPEGDRRRWPAPTPRPASSCSTRPS